MCALAYDRNVRTGQASRSTLQSCTTTPTNLLHLPNSRKEGVSFRSKLLQLAHVIRWAFRRQALIGRYQRAFDDLWSDLAS